MIKQSIYTVFIICLLIFEGVLSNLVELPRQFQMVPYTVFIMLMLLSFKYNNKWLISLIMMCSISYDILYAPYYFVFLVLYLMSYSMILQMKKIFFVNFFVELIVILLGVTVIDFTLYLINQVSFPYYDYFSEYLSHRLGFSLLFNGFVTVILYMIVQLIERFKFRQSDVKVTINSAKLIKKSVVKRLK